ncbi:MAG: class I tRNA ligase family protein, partial [Proteobacteria bacterium]|nr:class I tRNA ligase family protein [Pseudomonadota bacterium]
HSSLLESVGTRGRAPYRNVLTHGFVVDGEGKKMSKSIGNVIDSQTIIDDYGAEILRLWVAAEDYTEDIRISGEILKRLVEAYRRIRNTSRFILGNLYDFNPGTDTVPYKDMEEMDRWILHRLQEVIRRVRDAYEQYQFHVVYYNLHNFCTVDLSSLYLDVLKDRLYTAKASSRARRSAQTVVMEILEAMARLLAPILTFTAEEVWLALPDYPGKSGSVHLTQLPEINEAYLQPELAERWKTLIAVKGEVARAIETTRQNKVLGHSLDAAVAIAVPEKLRDLLATHREDLRALLIVSDVRIVDEQAIGEAYRSADIAGLVVGVSRAKGEKCHRCWVYSETVGTCAEHPALCERCLGNL